MKNKFSIKSVIILITSSLFLFAVACDRQDTAEKSTLKAAVADWTGGEITCQVAVSMLEEELGYKVKRVVFPSGTGLWEAIAAGEIDFACESWPSYAEADTVMMKGPLIYDGKTMFNYEGDGTVKLLGSNITLMNEDQRAQMRAQDVGFVFQSFHLMPRLSALDNVMLPLEIAGDPDAIEKSQIALDLVGLSSRAKNFATQLSGGEKQRVAIARAIVNKPKILFADEPTGNLDQKSSNAVTDLLFSINELINTTLVLVTHDLLLAEKCKDIYELSDGSLL